MAIKTSTHTLKNRRLRGLIGRTVIVYNIGVFEIVLLRFMVTACACQQLAAGVREFDPHTYRQLGQPPQCSLKLSGRVYLLAMTRPNTLNIAVSHSVISWGAEFHSCQMLQLQILYYSTNSWWLQIRYIYLQHYMTIITAITLHNTGKELT